MSDREKFDPIRTRANIGKRLSRVSSLYLDLWDQALNDHDDVDFPGGSALNMLGPITVPQDWQRVFDYMEYQGHEKLGTYADSQTDEREHPVVVLAHWTRVVREERGEETRLSPTLARESDYLRHCIDWMVRVDEYGEPEWFEVVELEEDLRVLVRRMEDLLRCGIQIDRGAPCLKCGKQLVRRWVGDKNDPHPETDDVWLCKNEECDISEYPYANYLKAQEAYYLDNSKWLTADEMEQRWRIKAGTLQGWASKGEVDKKRNFHTGRMTYNVAQAKQRREEAEAKKQQKLGA